ncbi:histidine kinase [Paenibacillus sp. VCA1]|uniref:sensor histidine kinase n=1 Tax=Paenibacillus sp. VCA1 TaxID=3039148 RepID=UPI002870BA67|nr:histidine kinase [Paenibacillus sp. VCA1]MDR9853127.1 histidine kinase [Paenibacillus sp. VCA1]
MSFYRKLSIRSQLSFIAASIAAVMLTIIAATYFEMSGIIRDNNERYTRDLEAQIKETVHSNKDVIDRLMTNVAYNQDVQKFLVEPNAAEAYVYSKKIHSLLINMGTLKEGILDIVVLGENGRWYDLFGGNKAASYYAGSIAPEDSVRYFGLKDFGDLYPSRNVLLVGMKMKSLQSGERFNSVIGTLFFVIDPKALIGQAGVVSSESATLVYLVDGDNKIMSSGDPMEIGSELNGIIADHPAASKPINVKLNGRTYVVQKEELPEVSSMIVSIIPVSELFSDIAKIRRLELIVCFAGGIAMLLLFRLVTNNILLPLKKLMSFMNNIRRGDLDKLKTRISLQGYAEITVMSTGLNSMLDKVDHLTHQLLETNAMLYEAELENKKSELTFLRSQINPHFLYNTLEMVKGMAAVRGGHEIRDIAKSLGQIFRYSIKGENVVTLETEMGIVDSYMQIQQIRFGGRFHVRYELQDEAMQCLIPKMILQPIVENAVFHGLELKEQPGTLTIRGNVRDDRELVLAVEDDGLGMEPERLAQVRDALHRQERDIGSRGEPRVSSIGLANVNNRIKLTYGEEYGLEVESALGKGTKIRLSMPARRNVHVQSIDRR